MRQNTILFGRVSCEGTANGGKCRAEEGTHLSKSGEIKEPHPAKPKPKATRSGEPDEIQVGIPKVGRLIIIYPRNISSWWVFFVGFHVRVCV